MCDARPAMGRAMLVIIAQQSFNCDARLLVGIDGNFRAAAVDDGGSRTRGRSAPAATQRRSGDRPLSPSPPPLPLSLPPPPPSLAATGSVFFVDFCIFAQLFKNARQCTVRRHVLENAVCDIIAGCYLGLSGPYHTLRGTTVREWSQSGPAPRPAA